MTKRIRVVVLATSCLLVAACGSTVSTVPAAAPPGADGALPAPPSGGHVPTGTTTTGTVNGSGTGAVHPGGGGQPLPSSVPDQRTVIQGVDGPGVTATTLKFGVTYATDSGEANSAAGAGGIDPGDLRNYFNAVAKEINREGGVAGRRLVPSYFKVSDTSASSASQQREAACEHWTRDDRVLVILDADSDVLRNCAQAHGMASFSTNGSNAVAATFQTYPHYMEVSGIGLDRYLVETATGLAATDYYGPKPVIGIITWDDKSYRQAVDRALTPALRNLGYSVKSTRYVKVAETLGAVGGSSADVSAAVLRFRQDGIGHVFIADGPAGAFGGTGLTLLFINAASSQQYVPRYGMNDNNSAQAGLDAKLWQAKDVKGSRVVTWSNLDQLSDSGVAPNTRRRACLEVMRRHGLAPDNVNQQLFMVKACDYLWFLRAALGSSKTTVNRDSLVALATGLGTRYQSPLAYRLLFTPTQRDGIAGFRRQALDDSCGCYRYTSGIYASRAR